MSEETRNEVLSALLDGNRHTRKELTESIGIADRQLRKHIANLRCLGYQIVTDTRKGGYQITDDPELIAQYRNMQESYRRTIGKRLYMTKPNPNNERMELWQTNECSR